MSIYQLLRALSQAYTLNSRMLCDCLQGMYHVQAEEVKELYRRLCLCCRRRRRASLGCEAHSCRTSEFRA